MEKRKLSKSLFILTSLLVFGSIAFEQNSTLFFADGSPLDEFQAYRDEFGISTARLDMEDNRVIDGSYFPIEFENFDTIKNTVPIKNADPKIILHPNSQVPKSASDYQYHWNQDRSISGFEFSSYINEPLKVSFFDKQERIKDATTVS